MNNITIKCKNVACHHLMAIPTAYMNVKQPTDSKAYGKQIKCFACNKTHYYKKQ